MVKIAPLPPNLSIHRNNCFPPFPLLDIRKGRGGKEGLNVFVVFLNRTSTSCREGLLFLLLLTHTSPLWDFLGNLKKQLIRLDVPLYLRRGLNHWSFSFNTVGPIYTPCPDVWNAHIIGFVSFTYRRGFSWEWDFGAHIFSDELAALYFELFCAFHLFISALWYISLCS